MNAEPVIEALKIAAQPEVVYDLVADVSRMGEWSPEATGARRASATPMVGDKFVGTNKRGLFSWSTQCTVRTADRGREFTFDVDFGPIAISRWSYEFAGDGDDTVVTETWWDRRSGVGGVAIKAVGQVFIPGPRPEHNRRNIRATLRQLRSAAEAAAKS